MNKEDFNADYYFVRALEHYIQFQEHYYGMYPEIKRPVTKNELSVDLLTHIINHLAEEEVSYDAVFRKCLNNAKKRVEIISLEGLFSCQKCLTKARIPIEVKTTRDHIETITKNGRLDMNALSEWQNTEELFTLTLMQTDEVLSDCTCKEKEADIHAWVRVNTGICVHLSDELVGYLKESNDKRESKRLKLHK